MFSYLSRFSGYKKFNKSKTSVLLRVGKSCLKNFREFFLSCKVSGQKLFTLKKVSSKSWKYPNGDNCVTCVQVPSSQMSLAFLSSFIVYLKTKFLPIPLSPLIVIIEVSAFLIASNNCVLTFYWQYIRVLAQILV